MDKESMAKFKEKRAAATTEKLEEVPAPVYQTESRLKPILSPLRVDLVLQQLHDAEAAPHAGAWCTQQKQA